MRNAILLSLLLCVAACGIKGQLQRPVSEPTEEEMVR